MLRHLQHLYFKHQIATLRLAIRLPIFATLIFFPFLFVWWLLPLITIQALLAFTVEFAVAPLLGVENIDWLWIFAMVPAVIAVTVMFAELASWWATAATLLFGQKLRAEEKLKNAEQRLLDLAQPLKT